MIRLSIIIPFYNVEKFISQCLDSVFDQNIPLDEYEVICVNDGSPDNSREIVLDYMKRYPNLKLIEHDHNKKLGAARNTGRKTAMGKYIWNVDSDDAIEKNCLARLLETCETDNLDILMFGYNNWDGADGVKPGDNLPSIGDIMHGLDYMCSLDQYHLSYLCPVWNKIIKRDFLDRENIYSPEINMGEDVPYSFRAIGHSLRFWVSSECYYYYRLNPRSLTGKETIPTAALLYEKCIENSRLIAKVAYEIPVDYPSVRDSILSVASYTLQTMFCQYDKMTKEDQKRYKSILRKNKFRDKHIYNLLKIRKSLKYLSWLYF